MGAFEYIAMDQSGKQSKGLLEGDTPKHVRQLLRDRNLFPVSVTEVAQKEARRQRSFRVFFIVRNRRRGWGCITGRLSCRLR